MLHNYSDEVIFAEFFQGFLSVCSHLWRKKWKHIVQKTGCREEINSYMSFLRSAPTLSKVWNYSYTIFYWIKKLEENILQILKEIDLNVMHNHVELSLDIREKSSWKRQLQDLLRQNLASKP